MNRFERRHTLNYFPVSLHARKYIHKLGMGEEKITHLYEVACFPAVHLLHNVVSWCPLLREVCLQ